MTDDDADARDLLLARRLKLGVRLVIYPLLLGLLAVAWHARSAHGEDGRTPVRAHGWQGTAPGLVGPAKAVTSEGRLRSLTGTIVLPCGDGSTFTLAWAFRRSLVQNGTAVVADREVPDDRAEDGGAMSTVTHLEASVGDTAIRASLSTTVIWTRADSGRVVRCEGAPLAFTLSRTS
jgi:hypothetical protein